MKKNIHPTYVDTKVSCSCGNNFTVRSTEEELHIEVCDRCHPVYTGKQGARAQRGKIEKFNQKYGFDKDQK